MKDNQLQVFIEKNDVTVDDPKVMESLMDAFGAPFVEAGEIMADYKSLEVTDETEVEKMQEARLKRLALKKTRTGIENSRKELKANALKTGQAIDKVAKILKETIEPVENFLEEQEKFIEIKRAKEAAEVQSERIKELMKYTDNLDAYNLDGMAEETYQTLLKSLREAHEAKLKAEKEEAERLEKERIEKEAEQKRIREENEKLRKEAEAKEAEMEEERKKLKAEQDKKDAEAEKVLQAERAKAEEERKKREDIERKNSLAKAEEERRQKAEAEEERLALLAPDKEKLKKFAIALRTIRATKLPAVSNNQAQQIVNGIDTQLEEIVEYIVREADKL